MKRKVRKIVVLFMITALILLLLSKILTGGQDCKPNAERIEEAWHYVAEHGMDQHYCILVDYGLPSGCNRLWVWDFDEEDVVFECPVAHGRGHEGGLFDAPQFGNEEDSWLSSLGKCRVAERYQGQFGTSYRLDGLEPTNSNVRKRAIVLHAYRTVPQRPIYPLPSGRSKGCVMVAEKNMEILDQYLDGRKNVLLYTYCVN